jgi:polyisoprenyl-phosphate glycosyltransferase
LSAQTASATSNKRKLVSLVLPVYNEEDNVERAYKALCAEFERLPQYDIEFVFTDNHSEDRTFSILKTLAAADRRVRVIRFNRNYGFQRSLLVAYRHARGDAAVQIDCDLQDPPSLIPQFLALWEQAHDVVVGLRRQRQESKLLTFARRTFYNLLNKISDDQVTPNAGDFRLVSRSVLDQLRAIDDLSPYVRGLISSLAVNETGIPYDRNERQHGASKFPVRRLVGFALNGIIAHSVLPLRLATYVGAGIAMITAALSVGYFVGALAAGGVWPSGFATTTILVLFGISMNAIFLGIIGEYIARIYDIVRRRPLAVIEAAVNIGGPEDT